MRFQFRVVWVAPICLLLAACSYDNAPQSGNESARLSSIELARFKEDATKGSAEAAHVLMLHYRYADAQPLEVEKWLRYALENGDPDAEVSLGSLLAREHDFYPVSKESCARGVRYLEEAKSHGSLAATRMLEDLSPICTKPWLQ